MTDNQKTVDYFAEFVPEYALWRYDYAVNFIRSNARVNSSMLDIGCGTGNVLDYIRREATIKNVYGIDIAANYIEKAREKNITVMEGSILDTHFISGLDEKYDYVLLGDVLHHLVGKTRKQSQRYAELAIENSFKLVKKHGYLIIVEPVYYPTLTMDILFYVKRFMINFTSGRIQILGRDNNIGAPLVSYYTNEVLRMMIEKLNDGKFIAQNISETTVSLIMKAVGITRRINTTMIVQKI